jgi:quercetin dioxygenase-like cupin family protein
MRLNTLEQCPLVQPARKGFRGGSIGFRDLMVGQEGSVNNYGLQMVHIDEAYSTPQHRHNFEQVRIMLEGAFSFGPGLEQHEGSVGYFCEGTYYTQKDMGKSITLLLQIGGPSQQGFMSRMQLRRGIEALSNQGNFADGVFTWHDSQGKKHNQDSYEAVWEHVHGRPVRYPKPQYRGPVLLEPERFAWREIGQGVQRKHLGTFNEYGLQLSQIKLAAGVHLTLETSEQAQLLFCTSGEGSLGGSAYGRWSSAQVSRGESAILSASAVSEFYVFGLPDFSA